MISKETFVNTMQRLMALDHNMSIVDSAMKVLSPHFGGFYIPEAVDIVMEVLKDIFNDKDDWIAYMAYDLDYLKKYRHGCILDKLSNPIDLSTWGKVYDFLIENMEE